MDNDQTIEILMSELEQEVMDIFYKSTTATAELATKVLKTENVSRVRSD